MVFFCFFMLGGVLLTLQTTLFQLLPEWAGKPDPLFILVIFVAARLDLFKGAGLVLIYGLGMDIFTGIYLGFYPIIYLLLFFFLKGISRHLVIHESIQQIPVTAVSYLFVNSAIYCLFALFAPDYHIDWSWRNMLVQMIMLSVISAPFFVIFDFFLFLSTRQWFKSSFLRSGNIDRSKRGYH
ncbi:MAG: rod shape-determining protein MreD [Thermodesulfobacteriota bacterium]|nr:rod shape-determining protein MreD [Thermodesulfobacteriota bacterium]